MNILRSEQEIIQSWKGDLSEPKVSIKCVTYNHEAYIDEAIRGFLAQETNFPFEICIHDDASTDMTAEIIRKYESAYPLIIKVIYQEENQYSKGVRVSQILDKICKGKYIAYCEGDDYWADSKKIAIQAGYLDANPTTVISAHDAFVIDTSGNLLSPSKLPLKYHMDFSGQDLILGSAWLLTVNWMYRNIDFGIIPERNKVLNGDTFLTSILGNYGGSHHHKDIKPSAYRVHEGGVWSSLNAENKAEETLNTYFWLYRYYKRLGKDEYSMHFLRKYKTQVAERFSVIDILSMLSIKLSPVKFSERILRNLLSQKSFKKITRFLGK